MITRRNLIITFTSYSGLAAAYGSFVYLASRFLAPMRRPKRYARMFVTNTQQLPVGSSTTFTSPEGERFLLTHTGKVDKPFQAFSIRCPHLGCQVHWQEKAKIYFCPCHNGAFNDQGQAIAGPPLQAKQSLKSCPIEVQGTALYAQVEVP